MLLLIIFAHLSSPPFSVEVAVTDGFGQMGGGDAFATFEVGDGPRDFQDAVVSAGGEVEPRHGGAEQSQSSFVGTCKELNKARLHLRVAMDTGMVGEAFLLYLTGSDDTLTDICTVLRLPSVGELFEWYGHDFSSQIYSV